MRRTALLSVFLAASALDDVTIWSRALSGDELRADVVSKGH